MYSTSTTSTTSSSVRASSVPKNSERRVRVVRLLRPRRTAPAYGFSIRGGREYVSGFFVTKVEYNSEAHLQGLKVGDQLISVNGYSVEDAVHKELVQYLASQNRLKLKVRHVGMIPVKDKAQDSLSWQYVSERASPGSEVSSSPTLCHDTERLSELRISMLVPPRAKLGCGICKGPEWKPGIFVQFVRDGGIAREAGLRPGDQILSCNGQDFANITFTEAISAMRVTGRMDLVVREGAGIELVSPESSGYNSSASSAAGERSPAPSAAAPLAPPAALRRRLASVAEEAADRADRLTLSRLKRKTWDSIEFDWKGDIHNFDAPSDIEPDYDCPSIPNNPHSFESKSNNKTQEKEYISTPSNRTIINLTEDGATIQCSYENQTPRKTSNLTTKDSDKKTIVVEVHHTSNKTCATTTTHCNYAPPPVKKDLSSDSSSLSSSNSLSSAIAEEILKRKMNKKETNTCIGQLNTHSQIKSPNTPKPPENEKKKQHDALMDEFKKVHRKMFAHQEKQTDEDSKNNSCDTRNNSYADRQQTLPLRKLDNTKQEYEVTNEIHPKRETPNNPPPPPPMPMTNGHQKNTLQNGDETDGISKKDKTDTNNKTNGRVNGTLIRTPTPDYNISYKSDILDKVKANNLKDEKAEMDSLESFELKQPVNAPPKPPSSYFKKAPNGTETMKKNVRPVSVTIGEYAVGGLRKQPSKLDFLNGDKLETTQTTDDMPINNRLQSELVMTLSRSNLKKKTETVSTAVNKSFPLNDVTINEESDSSLDKNFHARYGNNILPLPPSISIPKVNGSRLH